MFNHGIVDPKEPETEELFSLHYAPFQSCVPCMHVFEFLDSFDLCQYAVRLLKRLYKVGYSGSF